MQPTSKLWESKVLIRFPDCDPFNHLNNARYIDYFFNAREHQLSEAYNFSLAEWGAKGKGWFVTQNQVAYLKPANYSETVIIVSRLLEFTDYELRLEMIMWDRKKVNIKSLMWSSFSHIDLVEGKRIEHNEELKSIFTAALYNEENAEKQNFDGRVEQLKTMKAVNAI